MTEVSSAQFDESPNFYEIEKPLPDWKKLGDIIFYSASFMAACALTAAVKKKRVITIIPNPVMPELQIHEDQELPFPKCTLEEIKVIEEIFNTIAHGSVIWNGLRLLQLGRKISHVHPFSLLLVSPRDSMRTIFMSKDAFKISQVVNGIQKGIEETAGIEQGIPAFAAKMGKDPDQIKLLIQGRDWKKFAHYLFDIDGEHEG